MTNLRITAALIRRSFNEIFRVPAAAIPGLFAPAIFMIGLSGVFGAAALLPGFSADTFRTFILPVGLLQGAGFTGAATGVNLARDIEQGLFDRLLLAPVPRTLLLFGLVASACLRSLMPGAVLLAIGVSLGVTWPGAAGLLLAIFFTAGFAAIAACWGSFVALKAKTQSAAPMMQSVTFASLLLSSAYAPEPLLTPWLQDISSFNPVNYMLEGVRQGFVGEISWSTTWHGLAAFSATVAVLGFFAVRALLRMNR